MSIKNAPDTDWNTNTQIDTYMLGIQSNRIDLGQKEVVQDREKNRRVLIRERNWCHYNYLYIY